MNQRSSIARATALTRQGRGGGWARPYSSIHALHLWSTTTKLPGTYHVPHKFLHSTEVVRLRTGVMHTPTGRAEAISALTGAVRACHTYSTAPCPECSGYGGNSSSSSKRTKTTKYMHITVYEKSIAEKAHTKFQRCNDASQH